MSVLKSKRNISSLEYANSFDKLCGIFRTYLNRTPRRRRKWLNSPIEKCLNKAYAAVAEARHGYFAKNTKDKKNALRRDAAHALSEMQPALWTLFNIQEFETKSMARLVKAINYEIDLLLYPLTDTEIPRLSILDYKQVYKAQYLAKLAELQRFIHGKVIRAPQEYDATSGTRLIACVNNAFVCAIYANRVLPTCHDEYERRADYLSRSLTYLSAAQQESITYFILVGYGEKCLREWTNLLNECNRLLKGVQRSDKQRFSSLP